MRRWIVISALLCFVSGCTSMEGTRDTKKTENMQSSTPTGEGSPFGS